MNKKEEAKIVLNQLNRRFPGRTETVFLVVCCTIIIASLIVYHFTPTINSDTVDGVIWAEASMLSGSLLSKSFVYGYVIPFGSNVFLAPFVAVFGATMLAESLGMLAFFALFLYVCYLLSRSASDDRLKVWIGVALLTLSYRSGIGVNLVHHILHYQLGFVGICGMYAMVFFIAREKQPQRKHFIELFLFALWSGANGIVTIVLSSLPVVFSLTAVRFFHYGKWDRNLRKCLVVSIAGTVFGFGLYKVLTMGVQEADYLQATSYRFLPLDTWINNIRDLPRYWLELFVTMDPRGESAVSISGITSVLSIMLALLVMILPVVYIIRTAKEKKTAVQELLVIYGAFFVWIITIAQFVLFRGPVRRLLYNGLFMNCVLIASWFLFHYDFKPHPIKRWATLGAGIVLACYAVAFPLKATWKPDTGLVDTLNQKGLKYGYSTFWNASYNTVLSGNTIKIRPVEISHGEIYPKYYNSDESWFDRRNNPEIQEQSEFFLLVDQDEYDAFAFQRPGGNDYLKRLIKEDIEVVIGGQTYENIYERASANTRYEEDYNTTLYHILVFSAEDYDQVFRRDRYIYSFSDDSFSIGCDTGEGVRRIHDGGVSFGPYMLVSANQRIRVTIQGGGLENAEIEVYSQADDVVLQPQFIRRDSGEIQFEIISDSDLSALEVLIRNPKDDAFQEDIVLTSETLEPVI